MEPLMPNPNKIESGDHKGGVLTHTCPWQKIITRTLWKPQLCTKATTTLPKESLCEDFCPATAYSALDRCHPCDYSLWPRIMVSKQLYDLPHFGCERFPFSACPDAPMGPHTVVCGSRIEILCLFPNIHFFGEPPSLGCYFRLATSSSGEESNLSDSKLYHRITEIFGSEGSPGI